MIEIPSSLIERIKTRQTVLVTGMGCCELAGLPGWSDLVERLCNWLDDEGRKEEVRALVKAGRQPAATAYLRAKLTDEVVSEVVRDAFPAGKDVPEALQILGKIPWRGVVTTTFDDLWDRALAGDDKNPTKAFLPRDIKDVESHRGRFLLHLFGSTAALDTVCLAPADLRRKVTPTGVGAFLDEVYRKRSFVFVGFQPGDSDLTMLSERLLGANTHEKEHFLLYPGRPGLESDLIQVEFGYTPIPYEGTLDEALRALGDAWRTVEAESRPADDDVEAWLEIWHRDPSDHEPKDVIERAEAKLRDDRNWDRLVDLLLGRMELLTDPNEQVATLREVGRIFEAELEAPDKAFTALLTAFQQAPSDRHILVDLERVAGKATLWNDFLAAYSDIVKAVTDPVESVRHWLEIARVYAEEINRDDYAIASFQHVLSIEPKRREAIEALTELLRKHERWAELVPVLETAATIETDRAKELDLRLQIADVHESRLANVPAAVAAYEKVLDLDAENADALGALERQYRKAERWKDLAGILEKKSDITMDPTEALKIRKERADLLEKVGDVDSSISSLEAVVVDDPRNRAALRSLEKLYDRAGRQDDFLRTLERLCDVAESDGERLLLLRRLAAEWEGRPDGLDRAADALEQVLQIDVHDEEAFKALSRVYRAAKRWHALVEATVRQIDGSDSPARKRDFYVVVGRIQEEDLRDPARALEAFASAEALGDERDETLGSLARLYETQGNFRLACETLDKQGVAARKAGKPIGEITEVFFRAGRLFADKLEDKPAAEDRYAKALETDPHHLGSLLALSVLYRARGEYLRSSKLMLEAEERSQNRIEKTRLLYEAGTIYQDQLQDEARGAELYSRVMALDPEHVEAARRLADVLARKQQWAQLEPVLDMLVRKVDRTDAADAADIHLRLAAAAKQLGNSDKALRGFEAAYALKPDARDVLTGFAALRLERKDWREARDLLRSLLDKHQDDLEPGEVVDIYGRLAECEIALADSSAAIAWYEKALGLDPNHRASLASIAKLHEEKGDFAALVLDKRTLAVVAEGDDKAKLLEEMGDLYAEKIENPVQAIASYQQALSETPKSRRILHKLQDLYAAQKHWKLTAEVIVKLAELESNPSFRAKYTYAAATIHRDELEDPKGAVELYNRTLDDAPDMGKAFDAVERILADSADWKELARNYRKMIKRLPQEGLSDLRLRLWNGLGEVSLKHLDDREMAMTAFEVAASLDRGNVARHELLADLYLQSGPDRADKAIAEHQLLLSKNPDRLGSYRALAKLYAETGARDKLWCVASTLSFLKKADADLVAVYEKSKPADFQAAKRKFTEELWQKVVHPDEDRFIDAIFMLVGHYMAAPMAQKPEALGLRRKERVELARDDRMPTRALRYAADKLDIQPAPDLFFKPDERSGLLLVNLQDKGQLFPALIVGQALAAKTAEREVIFELGKRLAFLRPERFVRYALPSTAHIDIALRAALALGGAQVGGGGHNGEVDRLTVQLRKLVPKPDTDKLALIGRKLLQAKGDVIDIQAWLAATDLTASRAGFVLAGDLGSAVRVISTEPAGGSPLPPKQRVKDLLAYSVSEDYFAVRKFLGLEAAI